MKYKTSVIILIGLLSGLILFHIAVIVKVIPYDIVWGGRLQNDSEMFVYETISIMITLVLGLVLLIKGDYIKYHSSHKLIDMILWLFLILFGLATIGNILAKTIFEKSFAVFTLGIAILILKILKTKNSIDPKI